MEGFEEHAKRVDEFVNSTLYKTKFIHLLKYVNAVGSMSEPVLSEDLEEMFNLSGSEVRKIIQNARNMRIPVASYEKGYFFARGFGELGTTFKHLYGRIGSMEYTISQLELSFGESKSEPYVFRPDVLSPQTELDLFNEKGQSE